MKLLILLRWMEYRLRLRLHLRVDGEQFKDASGDDLFSVTQVGAAAPEPGQEIVLQGGILDGPEN